ncbi:MAG: O-antigen ligase family protein [Alphaproteobacteria bacterium]
MISNEEKRQSLYMVIMEVCLFLIISLHSVNFDLIATVRPVDVIILITLASSFLFGKIRLDALLAILCILAILFALSLGYGASHYSNLKITNLGAIYKFFMPFLLFIALKDAPLSNNRINQFIKLHIFFIIVTSLFVYIHFFLVTHNMLHGAQIRPNFPFTRYSIIESGQKHAGHVYSAYISLAIIQFIIAWRYNFIKIGRIAAVVVIILMGGALVLTGSRNGIVSFSLSFILFLIVNFFTFFYRKKHLKISPSTLLISLLGFLIFAAFVSFLIWYSQESHTLTQLINRAFNILTYGGSEKGRVGSVVSAFNEIVFEGPFFIGISLVAGNKWYDNLIASLIIQTGLLGCVMFFLFLFVVLKRFYNLSITSKNFILFNAALVSCFNYGLANLATEFFLITRSVIPFIIFLVFILKKSEYKKTS